MALAAVGMQVFGAVYMHNFGSDCLTAILKANSAALSAGVLPVEVRKVLARDYPRHEVGCPPCCASMAHCLALARSPERGW